MRKKRSISARGRLTHYVDLCLHGTHNSKFELFGNFIIDELY